MPKGQYNRDRFKKKTPVEHLEDYNERIVEKAEEVIATWPDAEPVVLAVSEPRTAPDEAFWDTLPPIGAYLLYQARCFKRNVAGIKFFNCFRSINDEKGGIWACGETDEGIRITYEENQFAAQSAMNQLQSVRSHLASAINAKRQAKAGRDKKDQNYWADRIEELTLEVSRLEQIAASKVVHERIFPFEGRAKVL